MAAMSSGTPPGAPAKDRIYRRIDAQCDDLLAFLRH